MGRVMHEWPRRHRISVEHYYRMAEAGLFAEGERVELINGEIVDVPPMGSRHAGKSTRLADRLGSAVEGRASVRQQMPLRLDDASEPQPDIAVVRVRADYYESSHPTGPDVVLLVEISDSTLRYDREAKAGLYARHGIPELWIVDLQGARIYFCSAPVGGRYSQVSSATKPGLTAITALPGATVDLSDLLT